MPGCRLGFCFLQPRIASVIFAVLLAASPLIAQIRTGPAAPAIAGFGFDANPMEMETYSELDHPVAGRVTDMAGYMIRGALVQITPFPVGAGAYRMVKSDASGDFETFYSLSREYSYDFEAWLTVSKKGYRTAHYLIDTGAYPRPVRWPITLRPDKEDSSLLSQQDLISSLLPALESLGPSDGLPAKSEKDYARGVQEFVRKGGTEDTLIALLSVVKRNPDCAKCRTMLALAELESGDWDGAARNTNSAAQWTLKNETGGSPQALVLGGVMESWMHNPQSAASFLLRAVELQPKDPLTLQELGRAQLQLQEFESADAHLARAVAAGAGPEARLLWVQALLGDDKLEEANREMNRYLDGRDAKTMPLQVREIYEQVQDRKQIRTLYAKSGPGKSKPGTGSSIDYLRYSASQLPGLVPSKNQDDLKSILTAVGKNVTSLFRDFQNSTSVEDIHQEKLGRHERVTASIDGKYRYLCLMPSNPAVVGFTEYRQNVNSDQGLPGGLDQGYMLTSGFASAALVFHPDFQSESKFRYLGLHMLDGIETHVIAFAQIPMKSEILGGFKSGNISVPTFEQGLAWIDTRNNQIIRLRTDLLKPLPEVQLTEETTQIDYHEVHFKQLSEAFWLPKDVTVTVDWHGRKMRNEHQYADFKLFNVRNIEKISKPKGQKDVAASEPRHP